MWLTTDIRRRRELSGKSAEDKKNSADFVSHAVYLFDQALTVAAGEECNVPTAESDVTANTAVTATLDAKTEKEDHTDSNFSIDSTTADAATTTANAVTNSNIPTTTTTAKATSYPIVVTFDLSVLQLPSTNSNSSTGSGSVLGLSAEELLEMARIAGSHKQVRECYVLLRCLNSCVFFVFALC